MSVPFECVCGWQLRGGWQGPGRTINCPACGRTYSVTAPGRRANPLLVPAAAAGVTAVVVAVGLLAVFHRTGGTVHPARPVAEPGAAPAVPVAPVANALPPAPAAPPPAVAPRADPVAVAPKPELPVTRPPAPDAGRAPPGPPRVGELRPVPVPPPGRYTVGEVIEQEVVVTRRSLFRVLGGEVGQAARYGFVSRLKVAAVRDDGGLTVTQTIEDVRLLDSDPAGREELEAALRQAREATFEVAVGPDGGVTGVTAPKDPVRVVRGKNAAGQTLRAWSLLDADGWKELAGLTFFQPDRPLRAGATWTRPISHDWGPLGAWAGQTTYVAAGPRAGRERIDYRHTLAHRPPRGNDGGGLPVKVLRTTFETPGAGGTILYDPTRGRATAAEEVFRVRGAVTVSLDGAEAAAELEEVQGFELRVTDPATREMSGQPVGRRKK